MEIRKEKELLAEQPTSQEESALLKTTQLLLCSILSTWQCAGPSIPSGRGRALPAHTSLSGVLLPLLQDPSSQSRVLSRNSPLLPGKSISDSSSEQQLRAGAPLGCPVSLAKLALVSFLLLRTLLDAWVLCSAQTWLSRERAMLQG